MTINYVTPEVTPLAYTESLGSTIDKYPEKYLAERRFDEHSLNVAEYAGRVCYDSLDLPSPKTRHQPDYIFNILKQRHYSVLEHVTVTFEIRGVSRSFTHELVRHRHFSYSQESQRYVSYMNELPVVIPPAYRDDWKDDSAIAKTLEQIHSVYQHSVLAGMEQGLSKKQATEAARMILPNCVATKIVVTGNLRSWMEFLDKRSSVAADKEMQEVAEKIHQNLGKLIEPVFGGKGTEIWKGSQEHGTSKH